MKNSWVIKDSVVNIIINSNSGAGAYLIEGGADRITLARIDVIPADFIVGTGIATGLSHLNRKNLLFRIYRSKKLWKNTIFIYSL